MCVGMCVGMCGCMCVGVCVWGMCVGYVCGYVWVLMCGGSGGGGRNVYVYTSQVGHVHWNMGPCYRSKALNRALIEP
jgi:hypothetical protein